MMRATRATLLAALLLASDAFAQPSEELLGTFSDWQAMRYVEDGAQVCAMWTDPRETPVEGAHAFVAHRRGPQSFHEVSVQFATPLRDGATVLASIGEQRFELYSEGRSAWNPSAEADRRMVGAMRAGATLEVVATGASGASLRHSYSLIGFTAAHEALNEACGARY